jgi:hypothetical protein
VVQEDKSVSIRAVPRAPYEDGAVTAEPPLQEVGRLLATNRLRLRIEGRTLSGLPWNELQGQARESAIEAARQYMTQRGEPVPDADGLELIMAGHQPELFHPGVWVKNFALNGLARRHGLTPLNLIVDNDTVKATALRLPAPAAVKSSHPHAISEPFDRWTGEIPYEERPILDPVLFAGFADRAGEALRGWDYTPMLPEFWAEVRREAGRTPLLGECFAAARRTYERRWGCHNLELPVSALCQTEPFAWFACHLLTELPRFHADYNAGVHDYRKRHGIRSRNHPVPDLAEEDGWLETPFWGWRAGATRRGRLFARAQSDGIALRIGDEAWPSLPVKDPTAAWMERERQGLKVRSRALTNTLYARLFLSDLFIHGIGGGKYDELTDDLIRRFYECEPPEFLVLSATRLLPLPTAAVRPDDHYRLARELRDVRWNPQRHLPDGDSSLRDLAARKKSLIAAEPTDAAGKLERFLDLRAVTTRLAAPLTESANRLHEELAVTDRNLDANAVLRRRDYAFCLYPEETLRPFCTQFL